MFCGFHYDDRMQTSHFVFTEIFCKIGKTVWKEKQGTEVYLRKRMRKNCFQ